MAKVKNYWTMAVGKSASGEIAFVARFEFGGGVHIVKYNEKNENGISEEHIRLERMPEHNAVYEKHTSFGIEGWKSAEVGEISNMLKEIVSQVVDMAYNEALATEL